MKVISTTMPSAISPPPIAATHRAVGVSTESEASARNIARIITQVRAAKPALFLEIITDPRLMGRISAETGARVGGTLYSDSLTGEKGDSPTYIAMVRHNIRP